MQTNDEWNRYFEYRGVSPTRYDAYRLPAYLRQMLPTDKRGKIVDLGCGFGQNVHAIRDLGYTEVIGVEPSETACERASSSGAKIFCGTIEQYASQCASDAQLVIVTHVIEHLPKEAIIATLTAIRVKILAPGGKLFVSVPNASSPSHCYWRYEDWTHTCLFTAGSLLYVLKAAGYINVSIVDADCSADTRWYLRPLKKVLLTLYTSWLQVIFKITSASFHKGSPVVLSFEVKAVAESTR